MRNSIKKVCPFFNTNRMVEEYANQHYIPNMQNWKVLSRDNWAQARELVSWKQKVRNHWHEVSIQDVQVPIDGSPKVGDRLPIKAIVNLGAFSTDEVRVEAYIGRLDATGGIPEGHPLPLLPTKEMDGNAHIYQGTLLCLSSGKIGFTIRCYPYRKGLPHKFELGLLTWWETGNHNPN